MKVDINELQKIVEELNSNLENDNSETPENQCFVILLLSNYAMDYQAVKFGDIFLWDSEEGDAPWIENEYGEYTDEKVPLKEFIWKKFTKFVNDLNNVVAKTNLKTIKNG